MADVMQQGRPYDLRFLRESKHPVRISALWALKQALLQEKYEECREIVAIAKEFGAQDSEIYYLLEDPRRSP